MKVKNIVKKYIFIIIIIFIINFYINDIYKNKSRKFYKLKTKLEMTKNKKILNTEKFSKKIDYKC